MATPTKKPSGAVKSLAVKRRKNGSHILDATWKVPSALVKDGAADHATKLIVTWSLGISGKDPKDIEVIGNERKTSDSENLNSFDAGKKTYTRSSFYPVTQGRTLSYVKCSVRAANKVGKGSKCPSVTYRFKKPRQPSIAGFSLDTSTATISTTITTDAGEDERERYDTEYYFTVFNSTTNTMVVNTHTTSQATTIPLSYNASDYQLLGDGYIRVTCRARARGYAGASDWATVTDYYLAYPNAPVISEVSAPSDASSARVIAIVKTNETTQHPVTQVQLEALVDTEAATPDEAEQSAEQWDLVGGVDDGKCTALVAPVGDVRPQTAGRHSWLRVVSWYAIEDVLNTRSKPVEVTDLFRPAYTATGDTVTLVGGVPGDDGESALVTLAWEPVGTTDGSDGTELSWSDQPDTWRSTDDPSTYEVTYDDGPLTHDGVSYNHSASITIKGLDEGATTYVKARRYADTDSGITYGEYSNTLMVVPAVVPTSVVLTAPAYVPEGEDATVQWTFDSVSPQTAWRIVTDDGTVLAEDETALGAATIPAGRIAAFATDGTVTFHVAVSTGGTWTASNDQSVTIVEAPTLSASTAATLTAQPMAIGATCNAHDARLSITVTAQGTSGDTPAGVVAQAEGDVVWSGVVLPEWSSGSATVALPTGLDLVDGASYTVTVMATDPSTGLSSPTVTLETAVDWSHQAPDPDGCATLTPIDTVDADGISTKAVRISLVPPVGSVASDSYDIYRVTNDGAQLIGETFPLTVEVTDQFAPYGTGMEHRYRIACRTADGDVAWADFTYTMDGGALRIDWSDRYVELPYDIAISDGYKHDVDVHGYLDGSTDAFFNAGTQRTAKLTTDVLRLIDPDTIEAVTALAHHVGSAFVRTPTGAAYEAAVTVDTIAPTHQIAAVSITASEVNLTAGYMLPPYNVTDESEV